MSKYPERNQQNPPLPKKKRVDSKGNDKRRLFAKSGTATLLIAKGITKNGLIVLQDQIKNSIKNLGGETACEFIII